MSDGPFAVEPTRERPDGPPASYGVPRKGGMFIEWSSVIERLTTAEAYWIGTVMPDGRPHVVPVWGTLFEGDLFLETGSPLTVKNRNLAANRNVVVHLDGINDVLIVRGVGRLDEQVRRVLRKREPEAADGDALGFLVEERVRATLAVGAVGGRVRLLDVKQHSTTS